MGIAAFYGDTQPDEERFKVLDAALASGCNHWDTSNIYGDSEELIGKWFKRTGNRDKIFLATKFGASRPPRGDPPYVRECCDKSLSRLGIDTIDLFYVHRPDPKTPIEKTVGAIAELVKQGKVKYIGLSECTAKDIRRAHAVHPISTIQVEFSPFVLDIEDETTGILKVARELGITVVVYSPLARGLATGRFKSHADFEEGDFRKTIPKYSEANFPKILAAVDKIAKVGQAHKATPGQTTLAWILAQGNDFVVIPGTKSIKYLEENMGAENVDLSKDEVDAIRKIAVEADIPGGRYADMSTVLRDTPPLTD